jgi:hypothetical protein
VVERLDEQRKRIRVVIAPIGLRRGEKSRGECA